MTKKEPGPKGPPKAEKAATASGDPEKSPSSGGKRPAVVADASHPQGGGLSKRTKPSFAEEKTTVEAAETPTLGHDCFDAVLAFLPVDQLVVLRSVSKGTKATVDAMVSKRAQQPPTLDLNLKCRQEKRRIRVHQGWTEALQDRESVIDFAIRTGDLTSYCEPWELDWVRGCLRSSGSAGDQRYGDSYSGMYGYSRKVEWNDALEVSTALKAVTKYFQRVENETKRLTEFYSFYYLWDLSTKAKMNQEVRNILVAKETVISLILTNGSNSVSFSKIESEDEHQCGTYDDTTNEKRGGTVLVFRLDNEMEIYLNSSFYEDFTSDY